MNESQICTADRHPHDGQGALSWKVIGAVFAVALAARVAWGGYRLLSADSAGYLEFPDESQYWLMATNLAGGEGLADEFGFHATRMPLYPWLLSLAAPYTHGIVLAKSCQWLIGSLMAPLAGALAVRFFDRRTAILAGLLVAMDPYFIFFSSLLLTETLFITLLLTVWLVAARRFHALPGANAESKKVVRAFAPLHGKEGPGEVPSRLNDPPQSPLGKGGSSSVDLSGNGTGDWTSWILLAFACIACVYTKGAAVCLIVPLLVWLAIVGRCRPRRLLQVLVVLTLIVVSLLPWAARNRQTIGSWCWLTTRAGVSLYDGVGPQATGASDLAEVQQSPGVRGLSETQWNRHFMSESIRSMRADPARVFRLATVKLRRMWNPFPNVDAYQSVVVRMISSFWSGIVFSFAIAGTIILTKRRGPRGWRTALFLALPALCLTLLHCFFVGSVRYRLPAMPMIEIMASFALVSAGNWFLSRRRRAD